MSLTPGPGVFSSISSGVRHGFRLGVWNGVGMQFANLFIVIGVSLGLGALLLASETLFGIVKWAGRGLRIFLGIVTWRSRPMRFHEDREDHATTARQVFMRGFWVNATNPKGMIFFAAILPQFIDASRPQPEQFVIFARDADLHRGCQVAMAGTPRPSPHACCVTERTREPASLDQPRHRRRVRCLWCRARHFPPRRFGRGLISYNGLGDAPMTIKVGDKLPEGTLNEFIEVEGNGCTVGPNTFKVEDLVKGKKIAIFALPGAFTPTCSAKRITPRYLAKLRHPEGKNVDEIWCISVNDTDVVMPTLDRC